MPIPFFVDAQYRLARAIKPVGSREPMSGPAYEGHSKLLRLLGGEIVEAVAGRTVLDFGCGFGDEVLEVARLGARRAIGIDIQEHMLAAGRRRAEEEGLQDRCAFVTATEEQADIVLSLDAFEHFADPEAILRAMYDLLRPGGEVWASFGPTWYHPLGGHLFSIFPWAHLVLAEEALIRWRSHIRDDGATRYAEVAGGLNQMTIRRFESIVARSPFETVRLEPVPIRKLRRLHSRLTREWTTAVVRCVLRKPH